LAVANQALIVSPIATTTRPTSRAKAVVESGAPELVEAIDYNARIASPTPIASHRPVTNATTSHLPLSLMVVFPAPVTSATTISTPGSSPLSNRSTARTAACVRAHDYGSRHLTDNRNARALRDDLPGVDGLSP
jgi:hypothetical protein